MFNPSLKLIQVLLLESAFRRKEGVASSNVVENVTGLELCLFG